MTASGAPQLWRSAERESRISPWDAAEFGLRAVEEDPLAADPVRQQRRVLVVRPADDPVTLDRPEILCRCEEDRGTGGAVGGAGDHPAVVLGDEHDASILEAPELALDARARSEQRLRIDRSSRRSRSPSARPRGGRSRSDPRRGRARWSLAELGRCRVEDDIDGIRPVGRGQDRVGGMAGEELPPLLRRRTGLRATHGAGGGRPAGRRCRGAAPRGGRRVSTRPPRCRSWSRRRARRCSRPSRSRTAAGWSLLRPRNQSNDCWARSPCSGSPVTAKAASSASTNADASSGCSSPLPGAGSARLAAVVAGQPEHAVCEPGLVTEPAKHVEARLGQIVPPSATPPTISACGRRALS